jgi:hypothetical protein
MASAMAGNNHPSGLLLSTAEYYHLQPVPSASKCKCHALGKQAQHNVKASQQAQ